MNKVRPGTIFGRKIFAGEPRLWLGAVFIVAMGLLGHGVQDAGAQDKAKTGTEPEKPKKLGPIKQSEFVRDLGKVLDDDDKKEIHSFCDSLLKAKNTQIFILTVNSIVDFGGKGTDVIAFTQEIATKFITGDKPARRLTTTEQLKAKKNNAKQNAEGKKKSNLILFVVSKNEKKADIMLLGKGWSRKHTDFVQLLLLNEVNPQVNGADYSDGIWAGIEGLDELSRGPSDSTAGWLIGWLWTVLKYFLLLAVVVILIIAILRPIIFEKMVSAMFTAYESLRELIGKK